LIGRNDFVKYFTVEAVAFLGNTQTILPFQRASPDMGLFDLSRSSSTSLRASSCRKSASNPVEPILLKRAGLLLVNFAARFP
jgi:hypothetical protein